MANLTPLEGEIKRKQFLVLDIESKDGGSQKAGFTRPFMVGVYDSSQFIPFFDTNPDYHWDERYYSEGGCVDRAMRHILSYRFRGRHIYAHNAGRFDYLFLLPWLMGEGERLGYKFSIIPVSSSIQVLDVWRGNKWAKWRFLDSYKLIPTSLQKAAVSFGLPGKLQHDLELPENDKRWVAYNQQDCVELYNILTKFHHYVEKVLLGEVGITAPSTSMKLYRRRFLKSPMPRNEQSHDFVRSGYFGGRVEVFQKKGEKLRYYDINSSYPAAMKHPMPGGRAVAWKGKPPSRFLDRHIGFVQASVHVPDTIHIPPLPIRGDRKLGVPDGKLLFPTGNLLGVWEWGELQLALELGCTIDDWGDSVWFEPTYMFREFVDELYQYRDTNSPSYDEGLAAVVKIMLNSLYGKFGMKTLRKTIYRWDDDDLPDNAIPASAEPDCPIWYAEEEVDAAYIMPQISARVTALARVALYRAMQQAISLGGNVYYCDTDSVVTDVELPTSSVLGGLKDEFPLHSGQLSGEFLAPKLYMLEANEFSKVKAKGVQRSTRALVERLAAGETIYQQRLEKVGTMARRGFQSGPQLRTVPRTLKPDMGKRRMLADGSTVPYSVRMW